MIKHQLFSEQFCDSAPLSKFTFYYNYQVLRGLGKELGYEIRGNPVSTEAPGGRTTMIYTLTKDLQSWNRSEDPDATENGTEEFNEKLNNYTLFTINRNTQQAQCLFAKETTIFTNQNQLAVNSSRMQLHFYGPGGYF